MSRTNFRGPAPETHRDGNFTERLRQTMGTETDPEMYSGNTAGNEEFPEGEECFPLVRTMRQGNMRGSGGKGESKSGRGRDQD